MREKIRVIITGEDFVNSDYHDTRDCALARALKRKFDNKVDINVGGITVDIGNSRYSIPLIERGVISKRCLNNINKRLVFTLIKI